MQMMEVCLKCVITEYWLAFLGNCFILLYVNDCYVVVHDLWLTDI